LSELVGVGKLFGSQCNVGADLPLVSRRAELAVLIGAIDAASAGRGEAVLLTGEAGVGKTRLLVEARREAERRGVMVLRGRAVESGGAYRPLVDAFARASAPYANDPALARLRPTLARVLPGWVADDGVLAPMADPAAVLAEALIALLGVMAPHGAVLIMDDLHWADEDTVSVLTYLADSVEELPVAVLLAARAEPLPPGQLQHLSAARSVRRLPLRRLTPVEVADALRAAQLPELTPEKVDQLVAAVDGLPLVLDEFVRQLREYPAGTDIDMRHTTLAAAVQLRLGRVSPKTRAVLDAMSVLGETDTGLLAAVTGLDDAGLTTAIHDALSSTLLVTANNPLGVTWRHRLMREAVRDLLLPLEQQAMARRAADRLAADADPTEGQLRQAAIMYELAGYPDQAAQQLIRAARAAVRNAALGVAEHYLAEAQAMTGTLPDASQQVLIERIETLALAGRAADAYQSGMAALRNLGGRDNRALLVATARAAFGAGLKAEAAPLLARLEQVSDPADADLVVLRAHAALADRRLDAIELGQRSAALAQEQGRFDIACEGLLVVGLAGRRHDTEVAPRALHQALSLSEEHHLSVFQVRALAELGLIETLRNSDPTRFYEARELASRAGMVGMVAAMEYRISEAIGMREGHVSTYPTVARADAQARQLQLTGLYAQTRARLAQCLVWAGDGPLPGRTQPVASSEIDEMIAEAIALGERSTPVTWARSILGERAWLQGDNAAALSLIDEASGYIQSEIHVFTGWGVRGLLYVLAGTHPEDAFGPTELLGHHANWAARAYAYAIWQLRQGRSPADSIAEAEHLVRDTPYMRHYLRTAVAAAAFDGGLEAAEGWLREADAFSSAAGERALQRRIRHTLATIGAKVPRTSTGTVPPHLAKLGITARETEILRLVNSGLSNPDIAGQLFLSVRTVESHISSMLQKTGQDRREHLPSANLNG
jgi:DNA-binding CsgD family transcriptional regulator